MGRDSPDNTIQAVEESICSFPLTSLPKVFPSEIIGLFVAVSDFQPAYSCQAKYAGQGDGCEGDEFECGESILKTNTPRKEGAMNQENEGYAKEGDKSSVKVRRCNRKRVEEVWAKC